VREGGYTAQNRDDGHSGGDAAASAEQTITGLCDRQVANHRNAT
jgi:hypothetical protein